MYATSPSELCVANIKKYSGEIHRLNQELKKYKTMRGDEQKKLYEAMCQQNVDEIGGIKKSSIEPKPKITADAKRAAAVEYLESQGISNPVQFYQLFKQTQTRKYILGDPTFGIDEDETRPRMVFHE